MTLLSPTLTRCLCSVLGLLLFAALPTQASQTTCEDNTLFRWKGHEKKDCDWVHARKGKICNHKNHSARKMCPLACDSCGETYETKTKCPNSSTSWQFIKTNGDLNSCHKFPQGMECEFGHLWTGCNSEVMACTPTLIYQCNKDTLFWDAIAYGQESCKPTPENKPYGDSCNPSQCPPVKPKEDESCAWYQGDSDCHYDYKVTGCETGATSCSPTTMATCDPLEQKWKFAIIDYQCGTLEACDPDTYDPDDRVDPPDTYLECPEKEPLKGAKCISLDDKDSNVAAQPECFYQYKVKGCDSDTLQCQPGIKYTCDSNQWVQEPLFEILGSDGEGNDIEIACVADDPRWGQDCDPHACPLQAPTHGSDCSDYRGDETAACEYDYQTFRCSDNDDALCLPTKSFSCVGDETKTWQENPTIQILCPPPDIDPPIHYDPEEPAPKKKEDGPVRRQLRQSQSQETQPQTNARNLSGTHVAVVGKPCIPDNRVDPGGTCPETKPTETDCTPSDIPTEGCSYSYSVAGCTADTLQCLPDSIFYCAKETGKWTEEWILRTKCAPPYGYPTGECDPDHFHPVFTGRQDGICPDSPPRVHTDCSKTGVVDGGCPYRYIPVGCSDKEVKCLAIDRFYCQEDPVFGWQWQQASMRRNRNRNRNRNLRELALAQCPNDYSPPGECDEEGNYLVPEEEEEENDRNDLEETALLVCPDTQPTGGTDCSRLGGEIECPFNYQVFGCSLEEAYCAAVDTLECKYDEKADTWLWQHKVMRRRDLGAQVCDSPPTGTCQGNTFVPQEQEQQQEEELPGHKEDHECPPTKPEDETDCSDTGYIPGGCPYSYQIFGCTEEYAECLPLYTSYCVKSGKKGGFEWETRIMAKEHCPDGEPSGYCDGSTLILEKEKKPSTQFKELLGV